MMWLDQVTLLLKACEINPNSWRPSSQRHSCETSPSLYGLPPRLQSVADLQITPGILSHGFQPKIAVQKMPATQNYKTNHRP
jgi:hypothetical protein